MQTGVSLHFVPGSFSPHAATGFLLDSDEQSYRERGEF